MYSVWHNYMFILLLLLLLLLLLQYMQQHFKFFVNIGLMMAFWGQN